MVVSVGYVKDFISSAVGKFVPHTILQTHIISRHSEDDGPEQPSPCPALLPVNHYNGGKFIPGTLSGIIFFGIVYLNRFAGRR
jgi:hypothetical protein